MKKIPVAAAAVGAEPCIRSGRRGRRPRRCTPIKVSYQPALYWALPFHIATEKGWWKEVGPGAGVLDLPGRRAADRGVGGEAPGTWAAPARCPPCSAQCASASSPSASPTTSRRPTSLVGSAKASTRSPRIRRRSAGKTSADRKLHRRLRGAGLPEEMGPAEGRRDDRRTWARPRSSRRCRPATADLGRPVGAQHLHAGREGRRQDAVHRQGQPAPSCRAR